MVSPTMSGKSNTDAPRARGFGRDSVNNAFAADVNDGDDDRRLCCDNNSSVDSEIAWPFISDGNIKAGVVATDDGNDV